MFPLQFMYWILCFLWILCTSWRTKSLLSMWRHTHTHTKKHFVEETQHNNATNVTTKNYSIDRISKLLNNATIYLFMAQCKLGRQAKKMGFNHKTIFCTIYPFDLIVIPTCLLHLLIQKSCVFIRNKFII